MGGYSDSRINLRGFESNNIAVMINGVSMNDMEWGGVRWSNWSGLAEVTSTMQVQRGLGASRVSAPSIGGSINIVTRSSEATQGGAVSYTMGNDGYNRLSFNLSTGINEKGGWAMSILGSRTAGNGDDPVQEYTVTFNADGATPAPAAQKVKEGETAAVPAAVTKTGYAFLFWSLNGTSAYNFSTPVNGNIVLTAHWQAEATVEYWQVSWTLNGGAWPGGDNHASQVVRGGTLAEPAAPTKSGSTFDGWYKEAGLTNKVSFPYDVSGPPPTSRCMPSGRRRAARRNRSGRSRRSLH